MKAFILFLFNNFWEHYSYEENKKGSSDFFLDNSTSVLLNSIKSNHIQEDIANLKSFLQYYGKGKDVLSPQFIEPSG